MRYRVTHITRYDYSHPLSLCRSEACLLPRDTEGQRCLNSELRITPQATDLSERRDAFGNRIHHFAIQHEHDSQQVTAVCDIELNARQELFEQANTQRWETVRDRLARAPGPKTFGALPFLFDSPQAYVVPGIKEYALSSFPTGRPLGDAALELMQRIYHDFKYQPGFTTIATPLEQLLDDRRGVCQDFAHFGVACLRSLGLAARYVSGYIETVPPPGKERLVGADASHAWFSVFAGDAGWVDFDPTNNKMPRDQHITVAWGRDFSDVSPLRGVALGGGAHRVSVSVDVARQ